MNINTKIFYKYKSCDGELNDKNSDFYHLIDSLENKYFYFARPAVLNDKDECKVFNDYTASYDEINNWLIRHKNLKLALMKKYQGKDPVYILKKRSQKSFEFQQKMRLSVEKERNHFHIFSLTENSRNNKMWKLYAKNFTGVCLGYESKTVLMESPIKYSDKSNIFFIEILDNNLNCEGLYLNQNNKYYLGLIKVKYAKRKPLKCKVFALNSEQEKEKMKESFLVKNNSFDKNRNKTDWSYEQESRVILYDCYYNIPREKYIEITPHYPDEVLKEVLFGNEIDSCKKEKIINCIKENYSNYNNIHFETISQNKII